MESTIRALRLSTVAEQCQRLAEEALRSGQSEVALAIVAQDLKDQENQIAQMKEDVLVFDPLVQGSVNDPLSVVDARRARMRPNPTIRVVKVAQEAAVKSR